MRKFAVRRGKWPIAIGLFGLVLLALMAGGARLEVAGNEAGDQAIQPVRNLEKTETFYGEAPEVAAGNAEEASRAPEQRKGPSDGARWAMVAALGLGCMVFAGPGLALFVSRR